MDQLSIILLCAFVPAILVLILIFLCVIWRLKKKIRTKDVCDDLEYQGQIRSLEEKYKNDIDRHGQTKIPLMTLSEGDCTVENDVKVSAVFTTDGARKTPNSKEKSSQTEAISIHLNSQTQTDNHVHHKYTQTVKVDVSKTLEFDPPKGNRNLGNTCFFNSSLQALYFTKSFKEALTHLKTSSTDSEGLRLTTKVLALLEKQSKGSGSHTRELKGVLNAVKTINNQFGRGTQEDSYELINTLLGGIYDEVTNAVEKRQSQPEDITTDGIGTHIKNLFTGLFVTVYVYDSCNDVEVDFEKFTTLSIPIVEKLDLDYIKPPHHGLRTISLGNPNIDIERGLALLTQTEDFEERDIPCRICNAEGSGKSYRRLMLFQPPPVLVIHIDRFKMNDFNRLTKNTECVQYPRRINIAKFCSVGNERISGEELIYELYAVVVHTGAISGGHYYAYVNTTRRHDVNKWQMHLTREMGNLEELKLKVASILEEKRHGECDEEYKDVCEVKDNWFYVSDEHVRSTTIDEVLCHQDAYILFYEVQ